MRLVVMIGIATGRFQTMGASIEQPPESPTVRGVLFQVRREFIPVLHGAFELRR